MKEGEKRMAKRYGISWPVAGQPQCTTDVLTARVYARLNQVYHNPKVSTMAKKYFSEDEL